MKFSISRALGSVDDTVKPNDKQVTGASLTPMNVCYGGSGVCHSLTIKLVMMKAVVVTCWKSTSVP